MTSRRSAWEHASAPISRPLSMAITLSLAIGCWMALGTLLRWLLA